MIYLIGQIFIYLLAAFIFGLIIGWLLTNQIQNDKLKKLEKLSRINIASLEQELKRVSDDLKEEKSKARSFKSVHSPEKRASSEKEEITHPDDLKRIHGIGPYLEKRLNQYGIFNFSQLIQMDSEAIDKLSNYIGPFPDRIVRDDWIGQAKKLMTV